MFENMGRGWGLALSSFEVIGKNRGLIVFPALSLLAMLLIIGSFVGGALGLGGLEGLGRTDGLTGWALLYVFYFLNSAVIIFFNMALIHCTFKVLGGGQASVAEGIVFSLSRLPLVLLWAFISATVYFILKLIEDKNEAVSSFITWIFGALWSLATFFVIPVMVYENVGVGAALKRSAELFKNTWGERVAASFSFFLIGLACVAVLGIGLKLLTPIGLPALIVVLVSAASLISCVLSAAETVFLARVYQYATGTSKEDGLKDLFV